MRIMQSSKHEKFISTPIISIIRDAIQAGSGIGSGVETYPLRDYIFQTVFLKMTGASEQKLKCICWDMATFDYDYRYSFLTDRLGECSNIMDKNKILQKMIANILKYNPAFNPSLDVPKQSIIDNVRSELLSIIRSSIWSIWDTKAYKGLNQNDLSLKACNLMCNAGKGKWTLLDNLFSNYYTNVIYRHRNRCAHNLYSYQENLPTLQTLADKNFVKQNYFNMFFLLCVMDAVYIALYKEYIKQVKYML